eukprot:scpid4542/ scgid10980/ 
MHEYCPSNLRLLEVKRSSICSIHVVRFLLLVGASPSPALSIIASPNCHCTPRTSPGAAGVQGSTAVNGSFGETRTSCGSLMKRGRKAAQHVEGARRSRLDSSTVNGARRTDSGALAWPLRQCILLRFTPADLASWAQESTLYPANRVVLHKQYGNVRVRLTSTVAHSAKPPHLQN